MGRPQYSRPCDKERRLRSYRFVPFCFLIQTIMVGLLACGCQRHQVGGGHEGRLSETDKAAPIVPTDVVKPLAEFNRGAALLEQYQYARAAEKFQSVLTAFPAWTAARFNLGLALLNLPDAPDALDRAEAEFERVIAVEPDHRWAHFCLGVLYQHKGDFDKALDHFGKVHGSDPDDPFVGFDYAETLRKLDRNPEALRVLEKVIERDPGFVSAFYSLGMLYNRMRQRDKAIQVLKRFGELKPQELAVGSYGVVEPYAGRGKYFTALAADGLPVAASAMSPAPRVLFSPDVKNIDSPLASWTWAGSKVNVPGVAVGDVDADGDQDVVLAGVGALGGTAVVFNDGKGNFKTGPRLADKTVVPCLGDIDNDGGLDLWLGRAGRDLLLLGDGKGKFTQAPAQPEPGGAHLTTCAGWPIWTAMATLTCSRCGSRPVPCLPKRRRRRLRAGCSTTTSTARSRTWPQPMGSHWRICRSRPSSSMTSTNVFGPSG